MLLLFLGGSIAGALLILYGFGGGLYLHYHVRRRHRAADWKCQPDRWLPAALHRSAVRIGTLNLVLGAALSALLAYYIHRGGYTSLYFDLRGHNLAHLVISTAAMLICVEALTYYAHRAFHGPRLFAAIHRWHHRYAVTTPFVAVAMHPVEWLTYQAILVLPVFVFPVHYLAYLALLLTVFLHGLLQHSGVRIRALHPWLPSSQFHDDHHRYVHCNFGQSSLLLDWLHGTHR